MDACVSPAELRAAVDAAAWAPPKASASEPDRRVVILTYCDARCIRVRAAAGTLPALHGTAISGMCIPGAACTVTMQF